jgi:hypothetical protein
VKPHIRRAWHLFREYPVGFLICGSILAVAFYNAIIYEYPPVYEYPPAALQERIRVAQPQYSEHQMKRLSGVCGEVKDKKISDLTTHDEELIRACNSWDVPTIEELSPPGWWDKVMIAPTNDAPPLTALPPVTAPLKNPFR